VNEIISCDYGAAGGGGGWISEPHSPPLQTKQH